MRLTRSWIYCWCILVTMRNFNNISGSSCLSFISSLHFCLIQFVFFYWIQDKQQKQCSTNFSEWKANEKLHWKPKKIYMETLNILQYNSIFDWNADIHMTFFFPNSRNLLKSNDLMPFHNFVISHLILIQSHSFICHRVAITKCFLFLQIYLLKEILLRFI